MPSAAEGGHRVLGNPGRHGVGPGLYKRQGLPHALPFLLIAHAAGLGQPSFLVGEFNKHYIKTKPASTTYDRKFFIEGYVYS